MTTSVEEIVSLYFRRKAEMEPLNTKRARSATRTRATCGCCCRMWVAIRRLRWRTC